jgi:hypothetical protein
MSLPQPINHTNPDVYRRKALITRSRRQSQYAAGRQLQAQINAYQAACNAARKAGTPLPTLSDFTGGAK